MTTRKQRNDLINSLCRICGQEDGKCISIFGEEGKQQRIVDKLVSCLPLFVSELDELPKQICLTCLHKLDATWELTTLCKEGQILIADKLDGIVPRNQSNMESAILDRQVEKKMKELRERGSVCIGGSAVVFLAPASPEPPRVPDPPVAPVITSMVGGTDMVGMQSIMVSPGYLPAAAVPTGLEQSQVVASASATEPDKNNVYPESLIQVNPTNKTVYQHRNRSKNENSLQLEVQRKPVPVSRRNPPVPASLVKRKVPLPSRRGPVPKPMSVPAAEPRRRQRDSLGVPPSKRLSLICRYCNKSFPENIIDHHVNLHLRQSFQTCVECNKNFRSSEAMSRHKCESTDPGPENPTIDLDDD